MPATISVGRPNLYCDDGLHKFKLGVERSGVATQPASSPREFSQRYILDVRGITE